MERPRRVVPHFAQWHTQLYRTTATSAVRSRSTWSKSEATHGVRQTAHLQLEPFHRLAHGDRRSDVMQSSGCRAHEAVADFAILFIRRGAPRRLRSREDSLSLRSTTHTSDKLFARIRSEIGVVVCSRRHLTDRTRLARCLCHGRLQYGDLPLFKRCLG